VFAGELALDGRVRPIKGAIALAAMARASGAMGIVVPRDNALEAAVVEGLNVYGVSTLAEVVGVLTGHLDAEPQSPVDVGSLLRNAAAPIDFVEIRGQEGVKRAIVIAAAGSHNIVQLWPRGGDGLGRQLKQSTREPLPFAAGPTRKSSKMIV
jgi:magnesium chelatase family protein